MNKYNATHLTIDQMLALVKSSGDTDNRRFRATGPKGSIEGVILDAYLELLEFDESEGHVCAGDLRFVNDVTWELIS